MSLALLVSIPQKHIKVLCQQITSLLLRAHSISKKGFPERAIPPRNGGNVGNAIGIERQKGCAARKRSCRVATEEDKKRRYLNTPHAVLKHLDVLTTLTLRST